MDDSALQQQLEALAGNATNPGNENSLSEPISQTMARWQQLFGVSADESIERIMENRTNLTRVRISDPHWDILRAEKEAQGYDREAYEYELELQRKKANLSELLPPVDGAIDNSITYLVELAGLFDTVEKIQRAGNLEFTPPVVSGSSTEDGRPVSLCCVDGTAKVALLKWAGSEGKGFEPTIIVDPRSLQ